MCVPCVCVMSVYVFEGFCLHPSACVCVCVRVLSLSSQCTQYITHTYAQHMQVIVILKEFVLYGSSHTLSQYVLQVLTYFKKSVPASESNPPVVGLCTIMYTFSV